MSPQLGVTGDSPTPPPVLRAVIAASSPLVCEGLRSVLGGLQLEVVGVARSGAEAVEQVQALAPDLVFIEAQLLEGEQPSPIQALQQVAPRVPIIVLSLWEGSNHVLQAVALGASGYLGREVSPQSLRLAVDAALRRHVLLDRAAFAGLAQALTAPRPPHRRELAPTITPREWEVLALLADGLSYRDMARRLAVTVATVRTHTSNILKKLDLPDRARATTWAREHGLSASE